MSNLSQYVASRPDSISHSLLRLTCSDCSIRFLDISSRHIRALTDDCKSRFVHRKVGATIAAAQSAETENGFGDDSSALNIALCFRFHSVDLSRNQIDDILGVVAFRNVTALDLSCNRLKTLESLEPLTLLSELRSLNLTGNHVCGLLNYRALVIHMFSISSLRAPTLIELDLEPVSPDERKSSATVVASEVPLVSAIIGFRLWRLVAESMLQKSQLHNEMRSCGTLVVGVPRPPRIEFVLHGVVGICQEPIDMKMADHIFPLRCEEHISHLVNRLREEATLFARCTTSTAQGCWAQLLSEEVLNCCKALTSLPQRVSTNDKRFGFSCCPRCSILHFDETSKSTSTVAMCQVEASLKCTNQISTSKVSQADLFFRISLARSCFSVWKRSLLARLHRINRLKRHCFSRLVMLSRIVASNRILLSNWNRRTRARCWLRWKTAMDFRAKAADKLQRWFPCSFLSRVCRASQMCSGDDVRPQQLLLRELWNRWSTRYRFHQTIAQACISASELKDVPPSTRVDSHTQTDASLSSLIPHSHGTVSPDPSPSSECLFGIAVTLQNENRYLVDRLFASEERAARLQQRLELAINSLRNKTEELEASELDRSNLGEALRAYENERQQYIDALRALTER